MEFEYGKITMLYNSLVKHGISAETINRILEGAENIKKTTHNMLKSAWLKDAMLRLDKLVPGELIQPIREDCACCIGGLRNKLSKAIGKDNATLAERVKAANNTRFVFGHSVKQLSDNEFEVCYFGKQDIYRCPCLPHAEGVFPVSYCMCCGGHVKHHLQNALGIQLSVKIKTTALMTEGKEPCTFIFKEI